MTVNDFLHFRRIDIKAADDDHVFLALHDVGRTLLIHTGDVTGIEPGAPGVVCTKGDGSFISPIPITFHNLWPNDAQFSLFADGHFSGSSFQVYDLYVSVGQRQTNAP